MNKQQLITIYVAIGILSFMLIFPPWQYQLDTSKIRKTAAGPYRLVIMGPPEIPTTSKTKYYSSFNGYRRSYWEAEIDWVRLILPCAVCFLIASGFVMYYKGKQ